jgi:hypothetical protein
VATGIAPGGLLDPDLPPGFLEVMADELAKMNEAAKRG